MTADRTDCPLLEVKNLRIEFPLRRGTLTAVDDISFDIHRGEVLGLVGESGAGKSITGSALVGLLPPPGRITGGEINLEGRRIDDLPQEELRRIRGKKIGMVFQDPTTSLNPLYTVGQQLSETIRTHLRVGAHEARRRAVDLLREVGIAAAPQQYYGHYPHQFSGGMRQRIVIALALCGESDSSDRRRADDCTRCIDPSADHRSSKVSVPRIRHRNDIDHPRYGRYCGNGGSRSRDVRRENRRDRKGRGCDLVQSEASLHGWPHGIDPANRR